MEETLKRSTRINTLSKKMSKPNPIIAQCQKQRSHYIHRELDQLIKKQVKIFFSRKKLEKEMEDHHKDYILMDQQSSVDRLKDFRQRERERSIKMQNQLKTRQKSRINKLEKHTASQKFRNLIRAKENLSRVQAVQRKRQFIKSRQQSKLEELLTKTSTHRSNIGGSKSSRHTAPAYEDPKIKSRILTAKELDIKAQRQSVSRYLNKMKKSEQKSLRKQLLIHKIQSTHKMPKCYTPKRAQIEENQINNWKKRYEKSFERFNNNKNKITQLKQQALTSASRLQNHLNSTAGYKRECLKESLAVSRKVAIDEKLWKIECAPKRKNKENIKSEMSFCHNLSTWNLDRKKQDHNEKMHQIHAVIQKLKSLRKHEKLCSHEVDMLLSNLDANDPLYRQIEQYLVNTKEHFLEKKEKEEEERSKKQKKNPQKVL